MTQALSRVFVTTVLLVMLPVLGSSAAIQVNAVCEVGTCSSPDSIGAGQSSSGAYSLNLTLADGDQYSVAGTYSNRYPPQELGFFPVVTYTGNNGGVLTPSVQTDVLSLAMFQNFYDPTGSSWDGQYCESIPFNIAPMAGATGNVYFDGNGIGLITAASGSSSQSVCSNLTFTAAQNASATMITETLLDFTFLQGSLAGASSLSPSPEPGAMIPVGFSVLALLGIFGARKRRGGEAA